VTYPASRRYPASLTGVKGFDLFALLERCLRVATGAVGDWFVAHRSGHGDAQVHVLAAVYVDGLDAHPERPSPPRASHGAAG